MQENNIVTIDFTSLSFRMQNAPASKALAGAHDGKTKTPSSAHGDGSAASDGGRLAQDLQRALEDMTGRRAAAQEERAAAEQKNEELRLKLQEQETEKNELEKKLQEAEKQLCEVKDQLAGRVSAEHIMHGKMGKVSSALLQKMFEHQEAIQKQGPSLHGQLGLPIVTQGANGSLSANWSDSAGAQEFLGKFSSSSSDSYASLEHFRDFCQMYIDFNS
jgi:hypothetical protein